MGIFLKVGSDKWICILGPYWPSPLYKWNSRSDCTYRKHLSGVLRKGYLFLVHAYSQEKDFQHPHWEHNKLPVRLLKGHSDQAVSSEPANNSRAKVATNSGLTFLDFIFSMIFTQWILTILFAFWGLEKMFIFKADLVVLCGSFGSNYQAALFRLYFLG